MLDEDTGLSAAGLCSKKPKFSPSPASYTFTCRSSPDGGRVCQSRREGSVNPSKIWLSGCPFFFFFFFFSFLMAAPVAWKFLGQGLKGLNLSHSCGNTRSLNPLYWAGDQTCVSAVTRATAVGFLTYCTAVGTPGCHFCLMFY